MARGFEIGIETTGTIAPPDGMDWICCQPQSGRGTGFAKGHELKLVYPQANAAPEDFAGLALSSVLVASRWTDPTSPRHRARRRLLSRHPPMALSLQTHKDHFVSGRI